ncbi:hypothetical protein HN873_058437 [Arachis hypogaea]
MRCFTLSLLLLLLLHTSSSTCSSVLPLCNHHDNSNLLQFKNSFAIKPSSYNHWACSSSYSNKTASWNNGTDCCEWDGVTCDTTSGHVIGLDLSCSMLEGQFHPNSTLFHLTHLQQLNLAFNYFSNSPIYSGIGNLVSLTHLNLSSSSFGSYIPSTISHLSKLLSLHLSYNDDLALDESTWNKLIGNTTNLEELVLDGVDMSSIRDASLSLLMNLSSSLLILSLDETRLHGKFPTRIFGLTNLEELSLIGNEELKGELPKSNWSTPLRILDLSWTAFSEEIPDSISHLKSLNQLRLWHCQFDGLIPVSLCLSGNRLHGEILYTPSSTCSSVLPLCNHHDNSNLLQFKNSFSIDISLIGDSKTASWKNGTDCCEWDGVTCDTTSGHVIGLDLSCSMLEGEFHPNSTLFQLTHLQQLNLAFNHFSNSPIYPGIGNLVSLTHLNLSSSSFGSYIPSTISHLSKLLSLHLSYNDDLALDESTWNKLIGNTTNLEELVLDGVDMSSIRDASLSLLMNLSSSLLILSLDETRLHGKFPTRIFGLTNLEELSLIGNEELKGELPKSNWSTPLRILDLSWTAFSEEIPDSISHLKSLNQLRLESCQFDGLVPLSLWNLTQLTELGLAENTLHGEIPSLLSNLKHLTVLDLSANNFNGHIPDVFHNLTKLESLSLDSNSLGGQLPPSLFRLSQLYGLQLSYNSLEGPIPSKDTKLSKIKSLFLDNNLLNGTIPNWCYSSPSLINLNLGHNNLVGQIGEFSTYSMIYLAFSSNKLQGTFPNSIFKFENLTGLYLSSVNLSGHVDFHQLSKLKSLHFLDLSHNNFLSINLDDNVDYFLPNLTMFRLSSCKITKFPRFLGSIQDLHELDLSDNQIDGVIPKWFNDNLLYKWKRADFIDLSFNKLQGDLPIPPNGTYYFSVSNNNFTGGISSTICNASSLNVLILSHNNLTGNIPQCLGSFPSLLVLDLQINNFYGSIPGNFSKNNDFETIKLNGNQFEGPIPQSLAHCTKLQVLDLGDNNIEDVFPSRLEALQELQVLSLRNNKFYGTITCLSKKHPFPKLRIFDVSNNKFSGPLPMHYFQEFQGMMTRNDNTQTGGLEYMGTNASTTIVPYNDSVVIIMKGQMIEISRILTIFTTIDLSNNLFEGKIPQILGELNSLKGLNLSHNKISGIIPQTLCNLTNLEWLDLSWNQLKGEIPKALTNLNFLSVLNLSKNQLEGMIPTGEQFNTFQNDSYKDNPMLCGFPLSKSCGNDEEQPPSVFTEAKESLFGWKSVAVGYGCGVVFGMFLGKLFIKTAKPLWLARLICGYT